MEDSFRLKPRGRSGGNPQIPPKLQLKKNRSLLPEAPLHLGNPSGVPGLLTEQLAPPIPAEQGEELRLFRLELH
jgi:hypothetical protein